MAIDLRRPLHAALEAALEEVAAAQHERTRKPRLTAGRAVLLGAGVMTAGRLAASSRGRGILETVQQSVPFDGSRIFGRQGPDAEGDGLEDEALSEDELEEDDELEDEDEPEEDDGVDDVAAEEDASAGDEEEEAVEDDAEEDEAESEEQPKKARARRSGGRATARSRR